MSTRHHPKPGPAEGGAVINHPSVAMLTEHKRVKHGEAPGDLNRAYLIALRELRGKYVLQPFPWYTLDERDGKALRRGLADKSRKVQRRRDRRAIAEGLVA